MRTNPDEHGRTGLKGRGFVLAGCLLLLAGCLNHPASRPAPPSPAAAAGMAGMMDHGDTPCAFRPASSVHCGRTPTAAIDADGRLWVAYVVGERVYLSHSDDMGKRYSRPVVVNDVEEEIYTNGENRAKVAFGTNGEIYVSWTAVRDGPFFGDIRFTRSLDGGRSFEAVRTINDDGLLTSHRFETLFVNSAGHVFLAWLDKRDQVRAQKDGRDYKGAALYYTWSTDGGASFAPNRKVADYSCECCRVAMSETGDGDVATFWRHIYENGTTRDHGFAVLATDGLVTPAQRATVDNWRIDACPHHGPTMVTAADGGYHISWFTLGDLRKGIYYGHYYPDSGEIANLKQVGAAGSGHPYLARLDQRLYLVYKQFDGERTNIHLIRSEDEGRQWSAPISVAATTGASDHPLLLVHDGRVNLSWHTGDEGFRIIPLD